MDGSLVDVLISASSALDERGRIVGQSVIAHDITERRRAQAALQTTRHRLADAQRIAQVGSFEFDLVSNDMTWSEEHYRILGLDPGLEATADLLASMVDPNDRPRVGHAWANATQRGIPFEVRFRIIRSDAAQRWVHARAVPEMAEDGTVVKLIGTLSDDTDRVEADRIRQAAETRFEIGFEQGGIGAVIVDLGGVPRRVNRAACSLLGRPEAALVGRRWTEYTHPADVPLWQILQARMESGQDDYHDERRYLRPDGSAVWASAYCTLVRDESGEPRYFFSQLQDITARKQMEDQLVHQSSHDSLTGLANRALLVDRLVHALAGSPRRPSTVGVMFLDVDDFKAVNDSLGHAGGDAWAATSSLLSVTTSPPPLPSRWPNGY